MDYFEWPLGVPYKSEKSGWGRTPMRAASTTEMEGGDVRMRFNPGDDVGSTSWVRSMTPAQVDAFEAWLTTHNGVGRFLMPISLRGGDYSMRVVQIVNGGGGVSYAVNDTLTRVSFSLVVFPALMTPPIPTINPPTTYDSISGTGVSGQTVQVDIGGLMTLTTTVSGGLWSVNVPFLEDGVYSIRARYASGAWGIPSSLMVPGLLKTTLRSLLLGSSSGLVLD